ncbi:MAG: cysteine--tRNA ligase [Candidatus Marinimicrobia bacterium]|nr:cysteine--tRNA ligase [Candidatus Neomarinimicrobiota bacterium]
MALKFYNTMSRKKEIFTPLKPGKVGMYNCGPTVYHFAHIGNFRAYMFEDLLKRYLKFKGYEVTQVMNLTDVDDKIIKKCAETHTSIDDYTEIYKQAFFNDLETLNIEKAEHYPSATKHIPEMVDLVQSLLDKGLAYKAEDGNIFFKISAFPNYGKLQRLDIENMKSGGRVDADEYEKESANDFALWKAYKDEDGAIAWDTKLGKGRPGWHIECSAMSMKYLGQTFDIHTGGVDNIFPHHENEIAQSEGATGKPFVNYWLHCEHLLWGKTKMSKSLGNIIYINGLVEKGYSPREIRFTLLSTHYRQKLNFSLKILESSRSSLKRIDDFLEDNINNDPGELSMEVNNITDNMLNDFERSMDDDLNISAAMGAVYSCIKEINLIKRNRILTEDESEYILKSFIRIDEVLAILPDIKPKKGIDDIALELFLERRKARINKNWAMADVLRDKLDDLGYVIIDRQGRSELKPKN